jgi:hypothetical protein
MIKIKTLLRRRVLLLASAALLHGAAIGAPQKSYVVLSLAADKITIVQPRMETGSHMDRNLHEVITMPDDSLDIVSLEAAEVAIKEAQPSAMVDLFATRDPKLYAIQDMPDDGTDDTPIVLQRLKNVLAQSKATHLLLITRHRDDARMKLHESYTGHGKIAGVGFYVNEREQLVDVDSGDYMQGYVAAFAVLRYRLIDLAAGKTVRVENVQATSVEPTPKSALSAWQGMSGEQKVEGLRRVIRDAGSRAIAKVLTGS